MADEAITVQPTGDRGGAAQARPLMAAIMGPAHGANERIQVKSLFEARRFPQDLVRVYTQDGD